MKRMYLPLVAVIMFLLTGCAAQIAAGVASELAKGDWSLAPSKECPICESAPVETFKFGNFDVLERKGLASGHPQTYFTVYNKDGTKNDKIFHTIIYNGIMAKDTREMGEFNKMNELEKKHFIKDAFFSKREIDLGSLEEPKAAKAEKSPKETTGSVSK